MCRGKSDIFLSAVFKSSLLGIMWDTPSLLYILFYLEHLEWHMPRVLHHFICLTPARLLRKLRFNILLFYFTFEESYILIEQAIQ